MISPSSISITGKIKLSIWTGYGIDIRDACTALCYGNTVAPHLSPSLARILRGQKTTNELWALRAIGAATAILIGFFVLIFIASLGAWIWPKVGPVCWHWLQDSQLADIQSVIFSGAIGAVVTSYAQQYIKK